MKAIRASFLDFVDDPFFAEERAAVRYVADGALVVDGDRIADFGAWPDIAARHRALQLAHFPDRLVLPGFVDTHVHYPQTEMIAAYGERLLEWLERYTFPTELRFRDRVHADRIADRFCDLLLASGTTTAQVFTTTFPQSVDALFEATSRRGMCVVAGLTGIDRPGSAPPEYLDTADGFYRDSKALIARWHGRERCRYAVTPRFALGSTREQLARCGQLLAEHPDVWVNTHMSENEAEIAQVAALFPEARDYLNVYERAGIVGPKFTAGHAVHLDDDAWRRMAAAGASVSFCPASNLFLGSGLFALEKAKRAAAPVPVGLGSDVGAGNSFCLLRVLDDAYKVAALRGQKLSAMKALFLATLGGARALHLDREIGSFEPGKFADFVVLDPRATPVMAQRADSPPPAGDAAQGSGHAHVDHAAFGLVALGDDRAVTATYVAGRQVYPRPTA
ncbi:MAG: guanine deaminase [Alphaproteobacteria bacterium]